MEYDVENSMIDSMEFNMGLGKGNNKMSDLNMDNSPT